MYRVMSWVTHVTVCETGPAQGQGQEWQEWQRRSQAWLNDAWMNYINHDGVSL